VSGPLVSVRELAAQLGGRTADEVPALLDVRWALGGPPGIEDYLAGHIPGAAFVDLETELAAPPAQGGRHPLPELSVFQAAMRRAGVSNQRPAVVYDAAGGLAAARAWWLLRYSAHPDVRLLDGGLAAWTASGAPLRGGREDVAEGDFVGRAGAMPVLDAASAASLARRGMLLDARAPERFRGEHEPIDRVAGHVPGAVNLPTIGNLDASERFLEADRLRERFQAAGIAAGAELGAYCGSGVTAAHEVLALELAGFRAALYPGSWSEWITDPQRPVATGPEPG
jgi:thiosulfate/3-mercaptopyruvate sulfurtransferase